MHNTLADAYAVRHGTWLLIAAKSGAHTKVPAWFNQEGGYADDELPGELYDLANDLPQKNNLYGLKPEKVKELSEILQRIQAKGQVR